MKRSMLLAVLFISCFFAAWWSAPVGEKAKLASSGCNGSDCWNYNYAPSALTQSNFDGSAIGLLGETKRLEVQLGASFAYCENVASCPFRYRLEVENIVAGVPFTLTPNVIGDWQERDPRDCALRPLPPVRIVGLQPKTPYKWIVRAFIERRPPDCSVSHTVKTAFEFHQNLPNGYSFRTSPNLRPVTDFPDSVRRTIGVSNTGALTTLLSDDNQYFRVKSTTGATATAEWEGTLVGLPPKARNLQATFIGKSNKPTRQWLEIWNRSTKVWDTLDADRPIGTAEVTVGPVAPVKPYSTYVDPTTSEMRFRVRGKAASQFNLDGELLRVQFDEEI